MMKRVNRKGQDEEERTNEIITEEDIAQQALYAATASDGESERERAEAMLASAREDIRSERENAMRQMQSEIGKLTMEAAAKIMESESGAEKDLALYDQFIKKAGDPDDNSGR